MYFNDINLYYDSKNPDKPLKVTYTCKHCGKEIETLKHFSIPHTESGAPKYHETKYMCDDCYNEVNRLITKEISNDKLWCEEYKDHYGNSDPKWGGTLTDLRTLPVGTKFFVVNGYWEGEILSDNRILVHAPTEDLIVKLIDEHHSLYLEVLV